MRLGDGSEVRVGLLDGFRVRLGLLVLGERAVDAGEAGVLALALAGGMIRSGRIGATDSPAARRRSTVCSMSSVMTGGSHARPLLNAVVLRTTRYIDAAVEQLRAAGHEIAARTSPDSPRSGTATSTCSAAKLHPPPPATYVLCVIRTHRSWTRTTTAGTAERRSPRGR